MNLGLVIQSITNDATPGKENIARRLKKEKKYAGPGLSRWDHQPAVYGQTLHGEAKSTLPLRKDDAGTTLA